MPPSEAFMETLDLVAFYTVTYAATYLAALRLWVAGLADGLRLRVVAA